MNEMILLGAGASVEAGIPDTYDMTKIIAEEFRKDISMQRHAHLISFVIGGLLFQKGIRDEDPLGGGVNVEELFNAVQLLAERDTLEAAPFVGSWHSMVQEFDKVRASPPHLDRLYRLIYEGVIKEILNALPHSLPAFGDRDIDRALEDTIKAMANNRHAWYSSNSVGRKVGEYVVKIVKDWFDKLRYRTPSAQYDFAREFRDAVERMKEQSGGGEIFADTAEAMIHMLTNIAWIDRKERVEYLKPLLVLVHAQKRLIIVTLNYDNGIELLAQSNKVAYTTGIEEWSKTGSFTPTNAGISLLKLHGSIDWSLQRDLRTADRPMPHSVIRQVIPTSMQNHFRPAVIFGQRNKLTAEGPFLDLLRAFQKELSQCELLTVVGYSFRDAHVNEYISQWLNQSSGHRIRIINPKFSENQSEYTAVLHASCRTRIEAFCEKAGEGLKRLYGPLPSQLAANTNQAQPTETTPVTETDVS